MYLDGMYIQMFYVIERRSDFTFSYARLECLADMTRGRLKTRISPLELSLSITESFLNFYIYFFSEKFVDALCGTFCELDLQNLKLYVQLETPRCVQSINNTKNNSKMHRFQA
jgi:hypothetical protein